VCGSARCASAMAESSSFSTSYSVRPAKDRPRRLETQHEAWLSSALDKLSMVFLAFSSLCSAFCAANALVAAGSAGGLEESVAIVKASSTTRKWPSCPDAGNAWDEEAPAASCGKCISFAAPTAINRQGAQLRLKI